MRRRSRAAAAAAATLAAVQLATAVAPALALRQPPALPRNRQVAPPAQRSLRASSNLVAVRLVQVQGSLQASSSLRVPLPPLQQACKRRRHQPDMQFKSMA